MLRINIGASSFTVECTHYLLPHTTFDLGISFAYVNFEWLLNKKACILDYQLSVEYIYALYNS